MKTIFSIKQLINRLCFALGIFASVNIFAAQQEQAYMTAKRYDLAGRLTGTISPDPDGTGALRLLATRNTYNPTTGLLEKVESGELANWSDENTPASAWAGFIVFSTQVITYDDYGRKVSVTVKDRSLTPVSLTETNYDTNSRVNCVAVRMNPASALSDACVPGGLNSENPDRVTQYTYILESDQVKTESRALVTSIAQTYVTNEYVGRNLLKSQTDANGNRTELRYDANFHLVKMVYPSPTTKNTVNEADYVEFSNFDANGNPKTARKRSGALITSTFDNNNRVIFKDYADNTNQQDVSTNYDLRGLVLSSRFGSDAGSGITTIYDGFGNVASSTTNMNGVSRTLSYVYDLNNNRTFITHPDGTYFGYMFDGLNRVKTINEGSATTLLNVNYATDDGRKSIVRTGGATTTYGLATNNFAKDDGLHLKTFTQDLTGTANDLTTSFTFNPANQIETLSKTNSLYYYQGNDDRAGTYTPNGLNQYAYIAGQPLGYDTNANLTNDGTQIYKYDTENRLISTSSSATTSSFVYDPNGRLSQTTIGGVTTQYLYDGDALVAEYSGSTVLRRYVHGDQVDEPLVQYNGNLIGASYRRYLHKDHQGSIIAHSDSSGSVFASNGTLAYDSFGIPATKNNSVLGAFGYTGQVYFPTLGINYYKARIYSPKLGRFLQTDPIGYKDQMNLYAYVGNDPLNKTDPTGEFGVPGMIYGAIAGGIGGYISSGGTFKEKVIGTVAGGVAGGAVGLVAPHTSSFVGMAAAGAVASVAGQVIGSTATAAMDKGVTNVTTSDVKVSPVVTVLGAVGAGVGGLTGGGVASVTSQGLIGNTLEAAGAPTVAGMTAGSVTEGIIGGLTEKLAPNTPPPPPPPPPPPLKINNP